MKQEKIQAYLLRVNKLSGVVYKGYLAEVDNTLEAEQRYVNFNEANGLIAVVSINNEIDVICNDEGEFTSIREEDIPVIESLLIPLMPDRMIDYEEAK